MPKRIQLRRTKGWRKPEGAVVVARPSKWGNPFVVGGFYVNRSPWADCPWPETGPARTRTAHTGWTGREYAEVVAEVRDRAHAVDLFRAHIAWETEAWGPSEIRRDLAGKDLACWCPLDQPCHADVLLEIANGGGDA